MLYDSHAHVNFEAFNQDFEKVLADCQRANVWLNNVGTQLDTSRKAVALADQFAQGVYAAIGLHPTHVPGSPSHPEDFVMNEYRKLAQSSKKVVAIGETGIDFFHDATNYQSQQDVFVEHIRLAKELSLPLIVHGRSSRDGKENAYTKLYEILKTEQANRGVIHCYNGTWEEAQKIIELGFSIGFTGIITYQKTDHLTESARNLPLDRILIETDCPYLAPVPHRGEQNYPQYVRFVAEKIAELRGVGYDEIATQTFENARRLFNV